MLKLRSGFVLILLMAVTGSVSAQITSDFANVVTTDGWVTANNVAGISHSTALGNPAGSVFSTPFSFTGGSGTTYFNYTFVAPAKFRGNQSAYYNGTLRYDLQVSSTGTPNSYPEVVITNNAGIALYYFPPTSNQPVVATWTTYSIALNNSTGFWKTTSSPAGTAATETQVQNLLADLANLEIRGLYRDANVTTRLDNVTMYPPIIINTQPGPSTVCNGVTATFTAAASNNPAISYRWQRESSPGVFADVSNGGGYSNATTATLSVNTTGNFGAGNYRGRIFGIGANDVFTSVVALTINPLPTPPTTTDQSSCTPGTSFTLSASGGSAGQYRWYTAPTGPTLIAGQTAATYTTPSLTVTTNYYVSINNGTCESARSIVTASIVNPPVAPTTTNASRCDIGPVVLSASGGSAGGYRWYTVPSGGTPITGEVNSTYATPNLLATVTYYVALNNGACDGPRTPAVATVLAPPPAPTAPGNAVCGNGTVILTASGGSAGQYRWYTVATGGSPIVGQNGDTYTTPALNTTTTFYVSINNGTCESERTSAVATINTVPGPPSATGNSVCTGLTTTLNATGGTNGQYRWYTAPMGGTAINGQVNSAFTTPALTATTTYYVSINNGSCESTRTGVVATITTGPACSNRPPVIETTPSSTQIGGTIQIDLSDLISDADNNLDLATLAIVTPPGSGATASINNTILTINYTSVSFTGTESITIRVCDIFAACTQQTFAIEVDGKLEVYNALSPGRDGKNDVFYIKNVDKLADTQKNHVAIYNRWGDLVWEADNYNNGSVSFTGKSKNDAELPSGTYYYKVEFIGSTRKMLSGYLSLKR